MAMSVYIRRSDVCGQIERPLKQARNDFGSEEAKTCICWLFGCYVRQLTTNLPL